MLKLYWFDALGTLTAVPRSTQPSTLRGMVKWVSACELSNNNKWRWCLRMVAANLLVDSQPKSVGLVWGWRLSLHSSNEPGELSQWLCHDDSTINIVIVIIIIIIIWQWHVVWHVVVLFLNSIRRSSCLSGIYNQVNIAEQHWLILHCQLWCSLAVCCTAVLMIGCDVWYDIWCMMYDVIGYK